MVNYMLKLGLHNLPGRTITQSGSFNLAILLLNTTDFAKILWKSQLAGDFTRRPRPGRIDYVLTFIFK